MQDRKNANLDAARGVAIREFSLVQGYGEADYLLFADGQAVGVVEAKREGSTLTGVEIQTQKYSEGVPAAIPAPRRPLPRERSRAFPCANRGPRARRRTAHISVRAYIAAQPSVHAT